MINLTGQVISPHPPSSNQIDSEDALLVSNDGKVLGAGHVRVYEWSGSIWIQKGADIDGEASGYYSLCFSSKEA